MGTIVVFKQDLGTYPWTIHILNSALRKKLRDSPTHSKCSAEIQSGPGDLFKGSFWWSAVNETKEYMGISRPRWFSLQSMLYSRDSADSLTEFPEFKSLDVCWWYLCVLSLCALVAKNTRCVPGFCRIRSLPGLDHFRNCRPTPQQCWNKCCVLANISVNNVYVSCNLMVLSSMQLQKCVCNSVISPAPMPCKTFCFVCLYQLALSRVCVFILWTFCLFTKK